MSRSKLKILAIGAHPDDCESKCAGAAAKWAAKGHTVRFVSATNGGSGHHEIAGHVLAQRRIAEAGAAARVIGIESQVLPIPTGQIEPILAYRWMFIRLIREFGPDLILTHRPNDYHPDHRYTSQLVQDSSYLVTVPTAVPETPHLRSMPVIMYMSDTFRKPIPFIPDVVIDIDGVMDKKIEMLHCHTSQVYEWLPYNRNVLDQVPEGEQERRTWLMEFMGYRSGQVADRYRQQLIDRYGEGRGKAVRFAEAFEACEYGASLDADQVESLFGEM